MKLRMISLLICVLCLLSGSAQADMHVTFEDMHYGDEAFQMHLNGEPNVLVFQGEEYPLEDDRFKYTEAFQVYGGKTHAVYEMTIPQNQFSAESAEELLVGTVVIDIPQKATLYTGTGNRRSGEYVLQGPFTLTDVYKEEIYLPRNENGEPVLIDRVYLYSYEVNGETRRFAATLYIDYDGYAASYADVSVMQNETRVKTPAASEETSEQNESGSTAAVAAILLMITAAALHLRKKKQPAQTPAKLPEASWEGVPFTEKANELLRCIQEEGEAITDTEIASKVDTLLQLCRKIIKAAAEQPAKEQQCRRFLSYYLPTTLKMLTAFRRISESGVSEGGVDKVRQSTIKGMDMILEACQKLLDNLYKGDVMDTSLDVEILEKMLKQDGLIENELDLGRILSPVEEQE